MTTMADNTNEYAYLPPAAPHHNEGKTVASWTAMAGVTIGALICALAVVFASAVLFVVGLVVIAVSLIVGLVLRRMGLGQPDPEPVPGGGPRQRPQR
jgi:ATP/ADP translocase